MSFVPWLILARVERKIKFGLMRRRKDFSTGTRNDHEAFLILQKSSHPSLYIEPYLISRVKMRLNHLAFLAMASAAPSNPPTSDQQETSMSSGKTSNYTMSKPLQDLFCSVMHDFHDEETGHITPEGIKKLNEEMKTMPQWEEVEAQSNVYINGVEYLVPEEVYNTEEFQQALEDLEDGKLSKEELVERYELGKYRVERPQMEVEEE